MRRGAPAFGVAALLTIVTGCGAPGSTSTPPASARGSAQPTGTVAVFAAASLQEAFGTIATQFERAHPQLRVKLNFGGSSTLAEQIMQGAPADVFASAATKDMQEVVAAGAASTTTNFAKNVMEIAVPPSNPGRIRQLGDLARGRVKVALCESAVPCGATARKVFANAQLSVTPATLEPNVKATLTKVELNEVDAGVVYVTDVRAAGTKVAGIVIPDSVNASTEYPIATLTHAANPAAARAFEAYVLSDAGEQVLRTDGFERP